MSETVQIAIITFLSGLCGAVVGAFSTYFSTKATSSSEMKKNALNLYLTARLNAYQNICNELANFSAFNFDLEAAIQVSSSIYKAILVSSEETAKGLREFNAVLLKEGNRFKQAEQDETEFTWSREFFQARDSVFNAMREDLLSFETPEVIET